MTVTRQEKVVIKMTLDKATYDRQQTAVEALGAQHFVNEGDTLHVTYTFMADYIGDIVKKLTAVEAICDDPAVIIDADVAEVRHGRMLVYEVLKKLDRISKKLRLRHLWGRTLGSIIYWFVK